MTAPVYAETQTLNRKKAGKITRQGAGSNAPVAAAGLTSRARGATNVPFRRLIAMALIDWTANNKRRRGGWCGGQRGRTTHSTNRVEKREPGEGKRA